MPGRSDGKAPKERHVALSTFSTGVCHSFHAGICVKRSSPTIQLSTATWPKQRYAPWVLNIRLTRQAHGIRYKTVAMSLSLPKPSKRLLRAAAGERDDLRAHRQRLIAQRNGLLEEVHRVNDTIAQLDQRLEMLSQVLGPAGEAAGEDEAVNPPAPDRTDVPPEVELIYGPRIREIAVRVLLGQPEFIEALHYRRWYDLLVSSGYAIKGKNPHAVFLTQLSRSPVIRRASQPGVYEIDRQAPLRLRQRLERLQAELRELSTATADEDLGSVRAKRHELNVSISQTERALEEALRVLRRQDAGAPQIPTGAR